MLVDKNILFITVSFFSYEKIIAEKLRQKGANVDFYDERPSNSIYIKGLLRINRDLYKTQIIKYYQKIFQEISNKKYDYFLLIKGEIIPVNFIKKVKENNPGIKLIYYNFDSFYNNPHALDFIDLFDDIFTFDSDDAEKYNIKFRPLFFSDDYKKLSDEKKNQEDYQHSVAFIGTAHSDRYIISEALASQVKGFGLSYYAYYYSQGKIVYFYKKFFDKSFKKFDYKKLSFSSLTHNQIIDIYRNTFAILDINHPMQKGLTMRTFETLGAGKKLITTNQEVKKYKFYQSGNVFVVDRENPRIDEEFFQQKPVEFSDNELYNMSLDGWVDDIFGINKTAYEWFISNP